MKHLFLFVTCCTCFAVQAADDKCNCGKPKPKTTEVSVVDKCNCGKPKPKTVEDKCNCGKPKPKK